MLNFMLSQFFLDVPISDGGMGTEAVDLIFKEESFDKAGDILKTKQIQYQQIEEYLIMSELFVKNIQKNHTTLLIIDKISINLNYTDDMFHTKS